MKVKFYLSESAIKKPAHEQQVKHDELRYKILNKEIDLPITPMIGMYVIIKAFKDVLNLTDEECNILHDSLLVADIGIFPDCPRLSLVYEPYGIVSNFYSSASNAKAIN